MPEAYIGDMGQKNVFNQQTDKKFIVIGFMIAFAIIGGIIALFMSSAAVPLTINSSLPVPQNVKAWPDDRNITVTWNKVNDSRVVGYYLTYRPRGSNEEFKVRQTIYTKIQLQPLINGTEYEIYVQSAAGSVQTTPAGPLVHNDNNGNHWVRANGQVSNKSNAVYMTPSSARVDAMRQRLTGFFDDFNLPAGPFEEDKWNVAATACVKENTAAAFINDQYHAHNVLKSGRCDRAGQASRPRAIFDTSVGVNGGPISESNPAQIEWDMDGISHGRDVWYLDIIPLDARTYNQPIDITSHNDADDQDREDPGNMLRVNVRQDYLEINYYNSVRNSNLPAYDESIPIDLKNGTHSCSDWGGRRVSFMSCDFTKKVSGISPIAMRSDNVVEDWYKPQIPNVRNHWVLQFTPTRIKVIVNGTQIGDGPLPAEFANKRKYTVHSTIFSYNTGKSTFGNVVPYIQMFHWDNFGFTGPKPSEVIYNYQDGGPDGKSPLFGTSLSTGGEIPEGSGRTTIIPIPDQIGNLVNNKARLYFTISSYHGSYSWASGDHILINGTRYDLANPGLSSNYNRVPLVDAITPRSHMIEVDKAHIRTGNNTLQFNIRGTQGSDAPEIINVHFELPYNANDPNKPSYTPPLQVFGQTYATLTKPPMTNCDQYLYVEQDLGLPYESGKGNLEIGPCTIMGSHQNSGTIPPVLDIRNFEAEEAYDTQQAAVGDDPNASKGKYIRF